jgi:hypothetical protein
VLLRGDHGVVGSSNSVRCRSGQISEQKAESHSLPASYGTGGVSSAYVDSNSILIAALIGFVIAFAWRWYRLRP